jgi:hypothetical protein
VTVTVITMLRHTGKVAAGALSAALVARLGWPALGVLAFLVVLTAGLICWVLSSDARVARVTRILNAWRGGIASPEPDGPAVSLPGSHRRSRQRKR